MSDLFIGNADDAPQGLHQTPVLQAPPVNQWVPQATSQSDVTEAGAGGSSSNDAVSGGVEVKKRRGRARKYAPPGVEDAPRAAWASPPSSSKRARSVGAGGSGSCAGKRRHRLVPPLASGARIQGDGFTPYVIQVATGKDLMLTVLSVIGYKTSGVCIMSAVGSVSTATLRQPSGGKVTIEGCFDIVSLSGAFVMCEYDDGQWKRAGALNVSLATPDGRIIGGGVPGVLIAASPTQVVATSFHQDVAQTCNIANWEVNPPTQPTSTPTPGLTMVSDPISRATIIVGGLTSPLNFMGEGSNNDNTPATPTPNTCNNSNM